VSVAIPPALEPFLVDIDSLEEWPGNARRGDVEGIRSSLRRFGQVRPILVQASSNRVIAGNHTRAAMAAEGAERIAALRVEIDDAEAEAYAIADNAHADRASWDDRALVEALERIQDTGGLEGVGFDADDLDDLVARLNLIPDTDDVPFEGGYSETAEQIADRQETTQPTAMREVVLLLTIDQAHMFSQDVRALATRYETEGTTRTVVRAVAEAAGREVA
jgi:ParB-like chromosome segregation protein Spo0J